MCSDSTHPAGATAPDCPATAAARPATLGSEPAGVERPRDKYRVLVVDDNVDSADTLAAVLDLLGSEVRTAYDGEEALRIVDAFAPQVVLLDIGMPRMNGFDVCAALRKLPAARQLLIVAMTGWGQAEDRNRTRKAGFDAHFVKPVDSRCVLQWIDEQLR
jgi:CheY-like chemotaxis protein